MSERKDGGPAFPQFEAPVIGGYPIPIGGMSLRDWFAGQALAGCVHATADYDMVNAMATQTKGGALEAKAAYAWADAMLAARVARHD